MSYYFTYFEMMIILGVVILIATLLLVAYLECKDSMEKKE